LYFFVFHLLSFKVTPTTSCHQQTEISCTQYSVRLRCPAPWGEGVRGG
jgi:hypothetical protein